MPKIDELWPKPVKLPVNNEPGDKIICQCRQVSLQILRKYIELGVRDLPQLMARTQAATGCGQCRDQLIALLDQASRQLNPNSHDSHNARKVA